MPELVTLETAKIHLRLALTDTAPDADVHLRIAQASEAIVGYLKDRADPTWDAATLPADVQAAVLLLLAQLFEHRGDDLQPQNTDAAVWEAIGRLLARRRDPALV